MIAPTNFFLLLFLIIGIPGITVISNNSPLAPIGFFTLIIFSCTILLDLLISLSKLSKVKISLEPAPHLTRNVEYPLVVSVNNRGKNTEKIKIAIPFPKEISTPEYIQSLKLSKNEEVINIDWLCTAKERGNFLINHCFVEYCSFLSLFNLRSRNNLNCDIHVYPDLRKEYKELAGFFLKNGQSGNHNWKMVGKGREFEKLREYMQGDCFEDIHWKTTAKRHRPVTKVYQIEKTQHIYIALDTSRWSSEDALFRNSDNSSLLDNYISAALILGNAVQRNGDSIGLLTFSNRVKSYIKAARGPSHMNLFRNNLYNLFPEEVNPDYQNVISHIQLKIRRRSLIIFLTNLSEPVLSEEFCKSIHMVSRKHLVIICAMTESHGKPLFSRTVQSEKEIYEHLDEHIAWNHLKQLERELSVFGVRVIKCDKSDITSKLVSTYTAIKQRQEL